MEVQNVDALDSRVNALESSQHALALALKELANDQKATAKAVHEMVTTFQAYMLDKGSWQEKFVTIEQSLRDGREHFKGLETHIRELEGIVLKNGERVAELERKCADFALRVGSIEKVCGERKAIAEFGEKLAQGKATVADLSDKGSTKTDLDWLKALILALVGGVIGWVFSR